MRILALTAQGFRNLPDGERIEFPPGLVFLQGPNEKGKSNLLRALKFALFRTDMRKGRARLKKWSFEGDFVIQLEFEVGGTIYHLFRSSNSRRDVLRVVPSGEELRRSALNKELARLTGVPSERAFDATCCVFEGQLPTLGEELQSFVERSFLGSGEVDVGTLVKRLDSATKDLTRGMKHAAKNPGRIARAHEELKRAEEAAAHAENLAEMRKGRKAYAEEVERTEAELADKRKAHGELARFLTAKADAERLSGEQAHLREEEARLDSMEKEHTRVGTELDGKRKLLEGMEAELGKAERSESRLGELEKDLDRLADIRSKEADLKGGIGRLPQVIAEDIRNAESIPRELEGLEAPLRVWWRVAQAMLVVIALACVLVAVWFDVPAWLVLAMASTFAIALVVLAVPLRAFKKEQVRKKNELEKLLSKYGASSPEELRSVCDERSALESRLRDLGARRAELLDGSDEAALKREVEILREHVHPIGDLRCSVDELRAEVTKMERLSADLEVRLRSGRRDMPKRKDQLAVDLAKARLELEGLESYASYGPEDRARIERGIEEGQGLIRKERREFHSLEGEIAHAERQAVLHPPDVDSARRRVADLERESRVYDEISKGIQLAKQRAARWHREPIGQAAERHISSFTSGRYTRFELSDDLSLRLWSESKGDWVSPGDEAAELSSGLADQLYLACRLAAIESLFKGQKPPVFLDDPLVHFDPDRTAAAIGALAAFAGGFQTIVLTCHSYELPEGVECLAFP